MHPRIRRLQVDYQKVMEAFQRNPRINIVATEGNPPEKYLVEFQVIGLVPTGDKGIRKGRPHRAEIFLPIDYPRRPPFCRMVTPVFHPNIDPQKICIGDHWSAGQSISELILRIAEMLAYQSYNVKSPLNAEAARWAEENTENLPLERTDLSALSPPATT